MLLKTLRIRILPNSEFCFTAWGRHIQKHTTLSALLHAGEFSSSSMALLPLIHPRYFRSSWSQIPALHTSSAAVRCQPRLLCSSAAQWLSTTPTLAYPMVPKWLHQHWSHAVASPSPNPSRFLAGRFPSEALSPSCRQTIRKVAKRGGVSFQTPFFSWSICQSLHRTLRE